MLGGWGAQLLLVMIRREEKVARNPALPKFKFVIFSLSLLYHHSCAVFTHIQILDPHSKLC